MHDSNHSDDREHEDLPEEQGDATAQPAGSAEANAGGEADPAGGDFDPDARQLVLVKHGQRYIFRYTRGAEAQLLSSLVAMARDPDCELDWFDAAVLSHQMGQRLGRQLEQMFKG